MSVTDRLLSALERRGIPEDLRGEVIMAIDSAGLAVAERGVDEAVGVLGTVEAKRYRVAGVKRTYLVQIQCHDGGHITCLEHDGSIVVVR